MAHFAEIDNNNKVLRVLVVHNDLEHRGEDFLSNDLGLGGTWIQTSYNAATNGFRKNYAGIGYVYDEVRDAFIAPKPYNSWVLDEVTCRWQAPTTMPTDGKLYFWDEKNLMWLESLN